MMSWDQLLRRELLEAFLKVKAPRVVFVPREDTREWAEGVLRTAEFADIDVRVDPEMMPGEVMVARLEDMEPEGLAV